MIFFTQNQKRFTRSMKWSSIPNRVNRWYIQSDLNEYTFESNKFLQQTVIMIYYIHLWSSFSFKQFIIITNLFSSSFFKLFQVNWTHSTHHSANENKSTCVLNALDSTIAQTYESALRVNQDYWLRIQKKINNLPNGKRQMEKDWKNIGKKTSLNTKQIINKREKKKFSVKTEEWLTHFRCLFVSNSNWQCKMYRMNEQTKMLHFSQSTVCKARWGEVSGGEVEQHILLFHSDI